MGGADSFVSLLGRGGFGFEVPNFEVFFAIGGFDEAGHAGDSLFTEAEAIGAVISNMAGLIEALGGTHGGAGGEAELAAGFDLESGGGERGAGAASAGRGGYIRYDIFCANERLEEFGGGRFVLKIVVERGRKAEVTGDLEGEFAFEFVDFAFAFDDEAQGWGLDATGRDGAGDFFADDTGEIVADKHIEGLAGLLAADHVHVDFARIFDSFI